jgi:hypothetical protein
VATPQSPKWWLQTSDQGLATCSANLDLSINKVLKFNNVLQIMDSIHLENGYVEENGVLVTPIIIIVVIWDKGNEPRLPLHVVKRICLREGGDEGRGKSGRGEWDGRENDYLLASKDISCTVQRGLEIPQTGGPWTQHPPPP